MIAGKTGNLLLDRLPEDQAEQILAMSRVVNDRRGATIYSHGGPIEYVYFPVTAVFSIVIVSQEGDTVEVTTIGREGMVGLGVYLGLGSCVDTTMLQITGDAIRIPSSAFVRLIERDAKLGRMMRAYAAYSLQYSNQVLACHALHTLEERACRYLLMSQDRVGHGNDIPLTHQDLADILGVRRQSISLVAKNLQQAGLIAYHRGAIQVIDRTSLESACCECYEVTKSLYERILP